MNYNFSTSDLLDPKIRHDLMARANKVGFKPRFPNLPRIVGMSPTGPLYNDSTVAGYRKRCDNWLKNLKQAEEEYDVVKHRLENGNGLQKILSLIFF